MYDIDWREIFGRALETKYIKGRTNNDQRSLIESKLVVCTTSSKVTMNSSSWFQIIKHYNIPKTTGCILLNIAEEK